MVSHEYVGKINDASYCFLRSQSSFDELCLGAIRNIDFTLYATNMTGSDSLERILSTNHIALTGRSLDLRNPTIILYRSSDHGDEYLWPIKIRKIMEAKVE